ncbi:MAG: HAD-IC family P-type ATPase [Anaerolineae bacterium]|nr:HAD-IC family P-type ATPase [Candidatus Roseilinea sp.]MDW8450677.1 HAD-IC family P-type ATPase [Anaerolineae bacterium]
MSAITGLTTREVEARRAAGQTNRVELTTSRPYADIIKANVLHPVNIVLYVIGASMALVGDVRSAVTTVALVLFNAAVGILQETRAKRQLDAIALLARAKVEVMRDGQAQQVDPSELVLGDVVVVRAGDQIPVDGRILDDGRIEVDESPLTGESDLIQKGAGDEVLSGSFCITGQALVEATRVGEGSFANAITKDARTFKQELTPLQRQVSQLLRVLLLIVLFFTFVAVVGIVVLNIPIRVWLQILAVVTGSVSAGLLVLITLNYAWGAARIGRQGALTQQMNAVESLSNVTVLCTDKTGTLTTNKIRYHDVHPLGMAKDELKALLGDFAASASTHNKTSQALADGLPGVRRSLADEVPFSSARKWSGLAFDDPGDGGRPPRCGAYVLGALEMLEPALAAGVDAATREAVRQASDQGLRVLAFAGNPEATALHDASGEPTLPPLALLGLVTFTDELRPHLPETLRAFADNGVRLKVISGDNPATVAALARQAGLPGDLKAVSGPELAAMSPAEFAQAATESDIFGRVSPQQKEALVTALRAQGDYVAMIGDGVNDVLSLKKANLGIAMESGSTATRSVAAIILLGDSFEAMPPALAEGQRIVASIHDILKLFMATVFALLMLIPAIASLELGFPFTALQNVLLSFFTRGAPPFVLALTAAGVAARLQPSLKRNLLHFTLPASILLFAFGLLIYTGAFFSIQNDLAQIAVTPDMLAGMERILELDPGALTPSGFNRAATLLTAQTALLTFFVLTGALLMVFVQPPVEWLAGGAKVSKNWLPVLVAVVLVVAYGAVLAIPGLRNFFQLVLLPASYYLVIIGATVAWAVLLQLAWRRRVLERFLSLEEV